MNSSRVINTLFGRKKNKLTWSGTLEDLKAFVLTIIDEQTAQSSKWHSLSGGKWCFNSEQLKVIRGTQRAKPYALMEPKPTIYVIKYIIVFF